MSVISDMDLSVYSDQFKDVHGFRPRGILIEFASLDEYLEACKRLQLAFSLLQEGHVGQQEDAVRAFETHITTMMSNHNISRRDAIRWDMQAEGESQKDSYLYHKGLPESYDVYGDR